MKETWKERFEELMPKTSGETISYGQFCAVRNFIEHLLEEQKKDLINQILSEAPEDRDTTILGSVLESRGFNQCNTQWKTLLTKHLK